MALVSLPAFAVPGDYTWPLGSEAPVTGTFGEYREGHFHTGVDFSTGGEIGKPVYAVSDGEVYRVADSLTGFGKAVYIRHADGNRSVYAHLDRFDGAIAGHAARLRRGMAYREKLDAAVAQGVLPVRQGQRIAFSGESGAGLPHLHFEIRRDEETPIHPFEFLLRPTDGTPPKLGVVDCVPVVEGGVEKMWIHFSVTDTSEHSAGYKLSPRKILYALDHRDTKSIDFDRLSYAAQENKKVGLIYDLAPAAHASMYVFRLFTGLPRPHSPSADAVHALGESALTANIHSLWIEVSDINGNASETEIPINPLILTASKDVRGRSWFDKLTMSEKFDPQKDKLQELASSDGRASCLLSPAMFYSGEEVSFGFYDPAPPQNDTSPPAGATVALQRLYAFEPEGVPLAGPATICFSPPPEVPLEKLGVFRLASHPSKLNRWSYVGSQPDSASWTVCAKIDRLAPYALFDDSVPPRIVFPQTNTFSQKDEIHVAASDRGSGIADTGAVEVDGRAHGEWYYDADRFWVRVIPARLKRGRHRMAVTMADRIGNVGRKEWEFRIR